jgi:hypothetical protein
MAARAASGRERRSVLEPVAWALGEAALVLLIVYLALGGRARDLHVPLDYTEDALEYLMQVQGTLQNGWWWTHPHLGAPGVFEQLTYPSNTTVDQAMVWLVHLVTSGPAATLNLTWVLLVALSAVIASACLRLFGISRPLAAVAGVGYALLPYALSRNIHHFSLAIYLVPIPCAAALAIAAGRLLSTRARLALVVGAVLVGLDYTYYAFFASFLVLVATLIAAVRDWRSVGCRDGLVVLAALLLATVVNLAPSFEAWAAHGRPLIIPDKTAAESEVYGLKIRQLLSPVPDHPFPPFARWETLERRAAFPSETENTTARLGLVASLGFLLLVASLIAPGVGRWLGAPDLVGAAAGLTLALVLLATIGGLGSLFSLLISPDIRAYDRVCPFLAFFAWLGVAILVDRARPRVPLWRVVLLTSVLLLAVWDQIGALAPLNRVYAANRTEWSTVGSFVSALERRLPRDAMVFQLPLTTYLNDPGLGRMRPYDEIKPYLASHAIHWSYPALDNAVVRWQHAVARLPAPAMVAALRQAGFQAIVINRDGYDDEATAVLTALTPPGGALPVLADAPGYVALDLTGLASSSEAAALPAWPTAFTAASAGLPPCARAATGHIDRVGPLKAPPAGPLTLERASRYEVRGWALDDAHQALAGDVDLTVDGRAQATFYGVNRPDVSARAGIPAYRESGVLTTVAGPDLGVGPHRLTLRVVSADRRCASEVALLTIIVPPVV